MCLFGETGSLWLSPDPVKFFISIQGEPITFCEESFVKHRSSLMKQFLETAVNLQLFKQVRADFYISFRNGRWSEWNRNA